MTPRHDAPGSATRTRQALRELVEALDRRLPQVERSGEGAIAAEAARLRALTLDRLRSLDRIDLAAAEDQVRAAGDVMSDDGGTPQA